MQCSRPRSKTASCCAIRARCGAPRPNGRPNGRWRPSKRSSSWPTRSSPSSGPLCCWRTFCGLRLGEIRALRVKRVDLLHRTVRVVEQYQQLANGTAVLGPPKTDAGVRTVAIPAAIVPDLEQHLANVGSDPEALLFVTSTGGPMRPATLHAAWQRSCRRVGVEGLRFHDLRHTGNTLAAATGASTKELMSRMGHASARAALIYQHATRDPRCRHRRLPQHHGDRRPAAEAVQLTGVSRYRSPAAMPL